MATEGTSTGSASSSGPSAATTQAGPSRPWAGEGYPAEVYEDSGEPHFDDNNLWEPNKPYYGENNAPLPKAGCKPKLPPGILSMEMWGECKVTWGKVACGATYEAIAHAYFENLDGVNTYSRWALGPKDPTKPQLEDLRRFVGYRVAMLELGMH